MRITAIDAHAAGEPLRLITGGVPAIHGRTMLAKRTWMGRHADHIRQAVMREPRGHADMCGAVLTAPASPGSHAGLLFMDNGGYRAMCGHAIIAVTTIVLERGLIVPGGDGRTIVFDTPAGTVRARATFGVGRPGESRDALRTAGPDGADGAGGTEAAGRIGGGDSGGGPGSGDETGRAGRAGAAVGADAPDPGVAGDGPRVESVAFTNVPSFVVRGGVDIDLGARRLRADLAYGGEFYAIVDSEAVGLPIDAAHLPELRRAAEAIKAALERSAEVAHPVEPRLRGICGVIFTAPAASGAAALRNVTISGAARVNRSASGTGTAAVMAVIDAMGFLADGQPFVHESVLGTTFSGRLAGRTTVGDYAAIVAEISGAAWVTGEHTFEIAGDDPFAAGFRL